MSRKEELLEEIAGAIKELQFLESKVGVENIYNAKILTPRTENALKQEMGFDVTVAQVALMSDRQLLRISGISRTVLDGIRHAVLLYIESVS